MEILSFPCRGTTFRCARFGQGTKRFAIIAGLSAGDVLLYADAVEAQYAALTERYTCYLFDRPDEIPVGYSIADMADDIEAVLRACGVEKIDVFGVSQGGMIAPMMALRHPELVRSLLLGSTTAHVTPECRTVMEKWSELSRTRQRRALGENILDGIYSPAAAAAIRESYVPGYDALTDEQLDRFCRLTESMFDFDIRDSLGRIRVPVLVLGAEGDRLFGTDHLRELAEGTGGTLQLYGPEYGHAVYDEAPDYVSRLLTFLEQ